MADIDIGDIATFGVIKDEKSYRLPPEAWTLGENVRFKDGGVERLLGWPSTFGTPPVAPSFAMSVRTPAQTFWIYTSLTKAYVWDGVTHTEITRISGDYITNAHQDWNGALLGGIAILNNGADVPQYWATPAAATDLADLTNWPANLRARVIRTNGPFLVALNLTESGNSYPHAVEWSHPADPGSIPSSWDIADPTKQAGRSELSDVNSGPIVDGLSLRGALYIYKESATHRMRFIGGRFVFAFEPFLETAGLLASRCASVLGDGQRHFIVTQDDILVHNGNTAESVGEKKFKRHIFNIIDTVNYVKSFTFTNPAFSEVWFCYCETGASTPNRALIYNYRDGTFSESTINFQGASIGNIEEEDTEIWDTGTDTWNDNTGPWSELLRRKVVLADAANTKFYRLDSGLTRDNVNFPATLQRSTLGVIGKDRNGKWIEDFQIRKFVTRVWPRITGGPVNIRLGTQETVDSSITWSSPKSFNPLVDRYVDFEVNGEAISIEFSTTNNVSWQLNGYKLELKSGGSF